MFRPVFLCPLFNEAQDGAQKDDTPFPGPVYLRHTLRGKGT